MDFYAFCANHTGDKEALLSTESVKTISGTAMHTLSNDDFSFNANFVVGSNTSKFLLRGSDKGQKLYMMANGTRQIGCLNCTKDQTITIVTADSKTVTAVTNVTLKSSNSDGTYIFTVDNDGDVKFNVNNYFAMYSITVADPSSTAKEYTVKYVNEEGTEIKNRATYSGEAGEAAVIYSTDKAKITYEGVNYCYTSDDSESKTIAADGSTVVTITFHEAATYNYTINAKYNDAVLKTTAGSSEEEDAVTYCYNKYYDFNGTLVQKLASNNSYQVSFTPNSDNYVKDDSYSLSDITNVIFFSEAEDIATLTTKTSQYLSDRFSGGKGAFAETSDKVVVTLPAGTYKLTAKIMGTYKSEENYSTFTFKAGENTIWESTTSAQTFYANGEIEGDAFTLAAETDIVLVSNGDNGKGNTSKVMNLVDYFYIQKVSTTNDIVGTLDFSTRFMGAHKDMTISKGETINLTFNNHGNGALNWNNWLVRLSGTTGVDHTLRADNFVIGDDGSSVSTRSITEDGGDINWSDFLADMQDSEVEMTITYASDGMFSIAATSTGSSHSYTHSFAYNDAKSGDITVELGVEYAWLEVTSVAKNMASTSQLQGYKTFYDATTNYQVDEHTTIYKAASPRSGDNTVTITAVEGKIIPKNTPVILKTSDTVNYKITLTPTEAESADDFEDNGLQHATASGSITGAYILAYTTDNDLGFYPFTGSLDAGDVYLTATVPAKALRIVVDGEATGIAAPEVAEKAENGVLYNLNGQQVTADFKGIVIKNGKKYFNK